MNLKVYCKNITKGYIQLNKMFEEYRITTQKHRVDVKNPKYMHNKYKIEFIIKWNHEI